MGVTAGEIRRDEGPGVGWADRAPITIVSPSDLATPTSTKKRKYRETQSKSVITIRPVSTLTNVNSVKLYALYKSSIHLS